MTGLNPHQETFGPWVSAGRRHVVPTADLPSIFPETLQEVAGTVAAAGGQLIGPAYAKYFSMPTDVVDVEIGFGIDHVIDAPSLTVTDHPATQALIGTHIGPYDRLAQSYDELMGWLAEQPVELADAMFECYDSPPGIDPEQNVTRMVFPLAD
ncbi:MAG: GyrI-like domain-containing protein [Micropruina sp.]